MGALKAIGTTIVRRVKTPPKGERGAEPRYQAWQTGVMYYSGSDGEQFHDYCYYNNKCYDCIISHLATSAPPNSNWREVEMRKVFASEVVLIGTSGWLISGGEIIHSSGKIKLTSDGKIMASNGKFTLDSDGNLTAESGTFAGFLRTKFIDKGHATVNISDEFAINASSYQLGGTVVLPCIKAFVGSRVLISNNNFPPYTVQSLSILPTTVRVEQSAPALGLYIGGIINPTQVYHSIEVARFTFIGGVVELVAIPHDANYCRWVVMSGQNCILSTYSTI